MKIYVETITPEQATQFLLQNRKNRRLRHVAIRGFAADMKAGKWQLTHQGIAFDEEGNLIDGQHRLHAVIMAGLPIQMVITTGLPAETDAGITKDAIDRGITRSIGDQLHFSHGFPNANQVAAIASSIIYLVACTNHLRITMHTTLAALDIWGEEIRRINGRGAKYRLNFRNSAIAAPIAFAAASGETFADQFHHQLLTGANLSSDSPALHLRNTLLFKGNLLPEEKATRVSKMRLILHRIKEFALGEKPRIRITPSILLDAYCWWVEKQEDKIAAMLKELERNDERTSERQQLLARAVQERNRQILKSDTDLKNLQIPQEMEIPTPEQPTEEDNITSEEAFDHYITAATSMRGTIKEREALYDRFVKIRKREDAA